MRSKKRTIEILIVVIVVLLGFASSLLVYRNNLSSENKKNNSNSTTEQSLSSAPSGKSIENFYDKPITDEKIALDSIEVNRNKLGYSDKNFTFKYDKTSSSKTAYHFDLYYKDIPVYGGGSRRGVSVITYHNNNPDVLMTGVSNSEKITKVNINPKITQDEALDIAKATLGDNFSEYNISAKLKQIKVSPKRIIYETQDKYVLSYRIISNFYICIINAENGEVITSHSTVVANVSEYEGQNGDIHQIFYDDYKDEDYDIKDALWNKDKNIIISDNLKKIMSLSDIQYGKNKSAVDVMANTYRAVEYFEKMYSITFDGTMAVINDKKHINHAAGIGTKDEKGISYAFLYFGERTNSKKSQLSAYLDIVAHEYTHAVTDVKVFGSDGYSNDSRYYERNALMEAYSDIFGELVEQKYTGKTNWYFNTIRNLSNPEIKRYTKRDTTKDKEGNEKNDYGYAHNNSTIISHVAYLMSKDHKSIKHSSYGSTKNLLDYNQLAQLWFGSLEYLKETEFMDFSDCRYAVEKSARRLIEQGVLVEDNLKVIEQAFNEVEVISNPIRRSLTDSMEIIKDKNTIVVPIEDETKSTEFVEITEVPTEPALQIFAVDLIDKTIPEIIDIMNGEYQIIKTENDGYIYIQNQAVLPGMEFYISVSGDDIIPANNGEELHSDKLKAKLESGKLVLDGIQVNKSGIADKSLRADMDYQACSKMLGDFSCIGGSSGYLGGDLSSATYTYNIDKIKVTLCFNVSVEMINDLSLGKISSISPKQMKSHNPNLINIVIRKDIFTESQELPMETKDIYEGETITLSGTLSYEHYEINSNNSDRALILFLDNPFIAKYCKSEAFEVGTTEKITSVQISSENPSQFAEGQYVTITGTIMNAHTAHHIRSIIITDIAHGNNQSSDVLDNKILLAVNDYLEKNQSNLGVWLSDSNPYCPAEYIYSNDVNWSCPINLSWERYSPNEIAGAYPYFAYVDKNTLKCTLTANYETVIEFDLTGYIN